MRRFIELAVLETLAGRGGELKEYRIGVEVFDRSEGFEPGTDPIVRVEARRLREKLSRYYESEGRLDDIVIELPKGGYCVSWRPRQTNAVMDEKPERPAKVAVLPFEDLTAAADSAYVADGLTWELIHGLTRVAGLCVVAWNSSMKVRGSPQADLGAARERLGVDWVLGGSVRKFGGSLRVVAQFVNAISGVYEWSETFERRIEEAADLQREISEAIIATLRLRLSGTRVLRRGGAYNAEAYQLYLRGRGQWSGRTGPAIREALASYQKAAEIDPEFAAAYAGMADAFILLAEYGIERPAEMWDQAKSAAMRAISLDPTLAEAYCSLGCLIAIKEWKWAEAEAHYRKALELNPGYAQAHHWFASDFLMFFGRFTEAEREIEIAHALDPLSQIIREGKSFIYMLQRRYAEAESELRSVLAADPGFYKGYASLGRVCIQTGRCDEAIEVLERGRSLAGELPSILGAMGHAFALKGEREKAREVLVKLQTMRGERHIPSTSLAIVHLGLGETGQAIERIREGMEMREFGVLLIGVHPVYDELRGEPEFEDLARRLRVRERPT
jgi:serine/threonine-protein kinase